MNPKSQIVTSLSQSILNIELSINRYNIKKNLPEHIDINNLNQKTLEILIENKLSEYKQLLSSCNNIFSKLSISTEKNKSDGEAILKKLQELEGKTFADQEKDLEAIAVRLNDFMVEVKSLMVNYAKL